MTPSPLEKQLYEALKESVAHHEYCGYGDRWERECADAAGLPSKLDTALEKYEKTYDIRPSSTPSVP